MAGRIIGACVLLGSVAVLAGCAGPAVKKADVAGQDQPVQIGFSQAFHRALTRDRTSSVVWARINFAGAKPVLAELSAARPAARSAEDEVLVYDPKERLWMPAFDHDGAYNSALNTFQCRALGAVDKSVYHPCGSGSRLVKTDAAASAGRNALATVLTFGLATGLDYRVDAEAVQRLLQDLNLMADVARFQALLRQVARSNAALQDSDKALIGRVQLQTRLDNRTGFELLPITPARIGLSMSRKVQLTLPLLTAVDGRLPFDAVETDLESTFQRFMREREFVVRCQSRLNGTEMTGTVQCPATVAAQNESLRPEVTVSVTGLSFGMRLPTLKSADRNLEIELVDGRLTITNLTDRYIEVKSVAVYSGKDVQENTVDLSIPPQSQNRPPIVLASLMDGRMRENFTFNNVTRQSVAGRSQGFGVAVKYRSGSGGNFDSLLLKRQIDLLGLLQPTQPRS